MTGSRPVVTCRTRGSDNPVNVVGLAMVLAVVVFLGVGGVVVGTLWAPHVGAALITVAVVTALGAVRGMGR